MDSTKLKSDKYILSYVLESPNIIWVPRALKGNNVPRKPKRAEAVKILTYHNRELNHSPIVNGGAMVMKTLPVDWRWGYLF